MRVYAANAAIATRSLRLTTESGPTVAADILDVTSSAFDHVVRSLDDLPAPSGGYIDLTSGSWAFAAPIDIGTYQLRVPAGTVCLLQGFSYLLTSNSSPTLQIDGAAVLQSMTIESVPTVALRVSGTLEMSGCTLIGNTRALVVTDSAIVTAVDSNLSAAVAGDAALRITGATLVQCTGGRWEAPGGVGMLVDGDVPAIQLTAVRAANLTTFVSYSAGSVGVALINGCRTDATTGIDWPFLTVPTQGLAIVGNSLDCLNPFVGFAVTDPRVNAKANIGSAGLLSETPIVP